MTLTRCGGVAHLGERLNGIQEVRGSIPLISTTKRQSKDWCFFFVPALFFCISEHFAAPSSPLLQVLQKAFSCPHNECVMNRRTPLCATLPAFA